MFVLSRRFSEKNIIEEENLRDVLRKVNYLLTHRTQQGEISLAFSGGVNVALQGNCLTSVI
jgi:hypothetical protein